MNKLLCSLLIGLLFISSSCSQSGQVTTTEQSTSPTPSANATKPATAQKGPVQKLLKTDAAWKKQLSEQEYYILRQKGTERAGTGKYLNNKEEGLYHCVGCLLPLFTSESKFKSGSGWPSFFEPFDPTYVLEVKDNSHGMVRTEIVCGRCNGHLGHVFDDGPKPTGLRYCVNGDILEFREKP